MNRGAETAFEAVANELAQLRNCDVTCLEWVSPIANRNYRFVQVGGRPRERFERWPRMPLLRRSVHGRNELHSTTREALQASRL